jgi:hypothetical protein
MIDVIKGAGPALRAAALLLGPLFTVVAMSSVAKAADLPRFAAQPIIAQAGPLPSSWTFRYTPYGWLTSLSGSQTIRGRTVDVSASFVDIIDETIGSGGTLVGLMQNFEARNGAFALFGDLVWTKIGVSESGVRTKTFSPHVTGAVGAAADLGYQMAIVELGGAYEIARFGLPFGEATIPAALDVIVGGRYWYQKADVTFDLATTLDIGDLTRVGGRGLARSGAVSWADPFVGARLRLAVAPGQEFILRGDVGGFGVGSNFSWQAIAGYSFDFAVRNGVTFSGVLGYRALYVDYAQGEGRRRYEFDMLQHGPILGVSMRF